MRSTLGSITATVSVRIGDGDPADIGTIDIPITVSPTFSGADIVVNSTQVDRNLADALHAAAHQLAPDVHPAQYLTDEDRERGARATDHSPVVDKPAELTLHKQSAVLRETAEAAATPYFDNMLSRNRSAIEHELSIDLYGNRKG